ncbi:hypothetical protein SV7mr_42540 [Stieleria bergensis]|uniref:Cytochrome c domain-containing protein n=1 Tax=Stieleria bergensis TaxID=2528025 RepID=A0A517SZY9_9BACT|nr:hypothetical protein SV7mr_42540 [Planctomycetes bacterium SV_7m_r]
MNGLNVWSLAKTSVFRLGLVSAVCLTVSLWSTTRSVAAPPLQLKDGDRVVLIGDGLIEQEQYFGWVEVMLTTDFPDADATFRNLGWNADRPDGASRFGLSLLQAGHEPADEGLKQLRKQLDLTQPTVAILGYGMAVALEISELDAADRPAALEQFGKQLHDLIVQIQSTQPNARFVLLSPIAPVGNSVLTKDVLDAVCERIQQEAQEHHGLYVDLTNVALESADRKDPIHLNAGGYKKLATALESSLQLHASGWQKSKETDALREIILEKNRLWFHRSRPANMAYVFGFRKHEQGQNAVEIPQFDPLIAEQEKRIAARRSLQPSEVTLPAAPLKSQYAKFTPQPKPEFVVADGLEVTLWAENPLLNKPIHMNFDAAGRLWVASSEAYPMIEVGQAMPDKVLILEDSNGDGTADKSSVFADGLLIPTGIAPGDGGVYVAQSTDLLFLKDTDGDGKADQRRRVLSGFGTEDTHHNLHTLLFGPDGRLYMNQSIYTRTDTETPYGVERLKAGGGFRVDTQTMHTEVFFQGLVNAWGHQFDRYGNSFMTDGAGFSGIAYVFPKARFNPTPKARRVMNLISPGRYPKFCSGEIINSKSFPESWQGSFVTCDFRANRVTRFSLSPDGAGFVTTQEADLIRTSASSFRPIDVKLGPDGALYVADWSNPIINHGEVDFRDPRRDRWHGRIWRITAKDQPLRQADDLNQASDDVLAKHLFSEDQYLIAQARRLLKERGRTLSSQQQQTLLKMLSEAAQTSVDKLRVVRLSAAIGQPNHAALKTLLTDADANVRGAAIRIVGQWSQPGDPQASLNAKQARQWLSETIRDSEPRVRLESIAALTRHSDLASVQLALQALQSPVDRFIDFALFVAVENHEDALIESLQDPAWLKPENQSQLEYVLTAVQPAKASAFLQQYLTKNAIPKDGSGPWIDLIGKAGGRAELTSLMTAALENRLDQATTAKALNVLRDAIRLRRAQPEWNGQHAVAFRNLIRQGTPELRSATMQLVGVWKRAGLMPELVAIASDDQQPASLRNVAVTSMQSCGGPAAAKALLALSQRDLPASMQSTVVTGLAAVAPKQAAAPFLTLMESAEQEPVAVGLWRTMLAAKDAEAMLLAELPKHAISQTAARAGVRAAEQANKKQLAEALMPLSGLSATASDWSPEVARRLKIDAAKSGDAMRGELVYRRSTLQCAVCHSIGGVGGKVGPDMTSLGTSAPVDYIIESLFDPNAKIKENYHSVNVLTIDGQVIAGIESESTDDEMVLLDTTGKTIRIPKADIEHLKQGKSLMPSNLLDRVSRQDQLDLIRFLSQLGRPGDFDASRQTVARQIEIFPGTHRFEQAGNAGVISGETKQGWKQLRTRVSGKIDRKMIEELTNQRFNLSLVNLYVRTEFQVASDSEVTFNLENRQGAKLWIDGQPVGKAGESINVSSGRHRLLLQIDARDLPDWLRIGGDNVTFVAD